MACVIVPILYHTIVHRLYYAALYLAPKCITSAVPVDTWFPLRCESAVLQPLWELPFQRRLSPQALTHPANLRVCVSLRWWVAKRPQTPVAVSASVMSRTSNIITQTKSTVQRELQWSGENGWMVPLDRTTWCCVKNKIWICSYQW